MLHRCIERERVGVDCSKIVDVDRHHDPSPGGTPAPPGERGRECNTPNVTCHICNTDSCHFRLCVMIFPSLSGFVFRFVFCHVMHFHIMSSCALHLHTCSSHGSEHFPRCPFCNPALLSPPVHPSCFLSCACVKLSRNGPRLVKWP